MTFTIKSNANYHCTLQRAFKTPMLCDVSKIHTGMGLMPRVTHVSNDADWGKVGSSKKVYAAKSLTQKGGYVSRDNVIERIENKYWKIEVDDFQSWMLGFYKFTGEWQVTEVEPNNISIDYTYTLHSKAPILYPLAWLFANLFWKKYMNQVLDNIRAMIDNAEPYLYE